MKCYSIASLCFILLSLSFIHLDAQKGPIQTYASTSESVGIAPVSLADHPRLFFSKGEEAAVLNSAKKNDLLAQMITVLKKEADNALNVEPQIFIPNEELLHISREQDKRMVTLAMAYRLFKDEKYAKKVEEELINVCNFPSWHPEHFLDDAEMTTAVAIGYDWCYDYLMPSTKTLVENAIREKAFGAAWPIYERTDKTPFNRENNWNMVCNSGMLNGALAIGDKYPEELNRILQYAVKNTPNLLQSFAPEGVFNEGPSYWGYNGMYMALLFDNLNRNIHNDFGLTSYKGLSNTANYYRCLIGPTGRNYNFGDGSENVDRSGTFFLLSKLYKDPAVADFYRNEIDYAIQQYTENNHFELPRYFFLAIPWFDDAQMSQKAKEEKITVFNGVTDFLFFNGNSINDKNRLWLAAKTGRPNWSHNHLDVGSFILDCDGERWGIDLGPDTYSLPKFWDYQPGGVRWSYFRNNNLAHNILSIDDKIANSAGQGEILRFNKDASQPYGIFNITSSYQDQASSVLRGLKLLSPDAILIRDELKLKKGAKKVGWRFLTNADASINGNTVTLTQNNKKFYLRCLTTDRFTINSFPARPNSKGEKPIKGVTIVEISVEPAKNSVTIPVVLGRSLENLPATVATSELRNWK